MARRIKRVFSAAGLFLAALAAPPISFGFFVMTSFVASLFGGSPAGAIDIGNAIGGIVFFAFLVTVWGALPAGAFGALGLGAFEAFRAGRNSPRWAFAAGGAGASLIYAIVGLAATRWAEPVGVMIAPWAGLARRGEAETFATAQGTLWITGCIVAAGGVAGWIYERSSRAVPPEVVRPALFLSDDEQG